MLATGGTLETVITMLSQREAASVTAVCLLAAPEGIERMRPPSQATSRCRSGWSRRPWTSG